MPRTTQVKFGTARMRGDVLGGIIRDHLDTDRIDEIGIENVVPRGSDCVIPQSLNYGSEARNSAGSCYLVAFARE